MTRSKSPWSSFRFKKNKKEAEGQETAAAGAEALRDYLEDDDTLRTIGKTPEALEVADIMVMDWALLYSLGILIYDNLCIFSSFSLFIFGSWLSKYLRLFNIVYTVMYLWPLRALYCHSIKHLPSLLSTFAWGWLFVIFGVIILCVSEHADGELEGMLVRKHEWESTTKKASNR